MIIIIYQQEVGTVLWSLFLSEFKLLISDLITEIGEAWIHLNESSKAVCHNFIEDLEVIYSLIWIPDISC